MPLTTKPDSLADSACDIKFATLIYQPLDGAKIPQDSNSYTKYSTCQKEG